MTTLTVRPATLGDVPGIAGVHVASPRAAYVDLLPLEMLDSLSVEARVLSWERAITAGDEVIVAVVDDVVVGFAAVGASRDLDPAATDGELYAIYCDPRYWSTGIGHVLHEDALVTLSSTYARASLWVLDRNERAMRFYRQHGWSPDGTTRDDDRGGVVLYERRYVRSLRNLGTVGS